VSDPGPGVEPVEGRPCPVCGLPDPDHDWDVHDASPPPRQVRGFAAPLPNMLARSSTRGRHEVRVLAVHTTEGILRAADLRAWAGWQGSSHASADDSGALLEPGDGFVPYHLAAWTLRSGNPWSENIELCGFAGWTRQQWLARPRLLDAEARWLARRHLARPEIPLVKITAEQYRAGASGVIDHHDHTVGYRDGTHWDVGEAHPWDVVLPAARIHAGAESEGLSMDEAIKLLTEIVGELRGNVTGRFRGGWPGRRFGHPGGKGNGTVVDYVLEADRELNSRINVDGRRDPAKRPAIDTLFGHVVSCRAEVRLLREEVAALAGKVAAR
jgi:hypothetical protein